MEKVASGYEKGFSVYIIVCVFVRSVAWTRMSGSSNVQNIAQVYLQVLVGEKSMKVKHGKR